MYWSLTFKPSALPFGLTGLADIAFGTLAPPMVARSQFENELAVRDHKQIDCGCRFNLLADININKQHLLPRQKRHLGCLVDIGIVHFQNDRNSRLQVPCGASVKRQKLTKAKIHGPSKRKPLSVRYAELLSLRRAVLKALSEKERTQPGRRRSN